MSELLERIRSGGHWRVLIRPASFGKKRIPNVDELFHLLDNTSVRLRGRAFPVIRSDRSLVFEDHIEYEEEDDKFAESWRFYQSGQLIHYFAFIEDRFDPSRIEKLPPDWEHGHFLDPIQVIFRLTEIFEFAARLSFSPVADGQTHLEISTNGIKGRTLQCATGIVIIAPRKLSHIENLPTAYDYSNIELIANNRELALKAALEIFQPFGWNPSLSLLKDLQTNLLEKSPWTVKVR